MSQSYSEGHTSWTQGRLNLFIEAATREKKTALTSFYIRASREANNEVASN